MAAAYQLDRPPQTLTIGNRPLGWQNRNWSRSNATPSMLHGFHNRSAKSIWTGSMRLRKLGAWKA